MAVIKREEEVQRIVSLSGVSRSTVFRYLAGKQIRPSSAKAIKEAEAVLRGEVPEGEPLREVTVSIDTRIFEIFEGHTEALSAIIDEARRHRVKVNVDKDCTEVRASGVILLGKHDPEEAEEISWLKREDVPFVVVNRCIGDKGVSYVASDVRSLAYDMCNHLLSQGATRVAFWGESRSRVSMDKFLGYKEALEERGLYDDALVFPDDEPLESIFSASPDAFMGMDDETATKVLRLAYERGLDVPGDFLVSGMNDLDQSKDIVPSLTSARIDFQKLGRLSLEVLLRLMDDKDLEAVKTTVSYRLLVRDSTLRSRCPVPGPQA